MFAHHVPHNAALQKRNLGDLLTADKLCVYKVVKSLARDALHNYGQRLYLIGKRHSQGSQRQKAVFMPAKWFFDRGDRARLTVTAGF